MIRERVAENVYVFTSEQYAQVNAGAIIGPDWAVVIDTLAFPDEAREIRDFLVNRLGVSVRYLINTHYHTDHTLGNSIFKGAIILSHGRCRDLLNTVGREALESARAQSRELRGVEVMLPDVVFLDGTLSLQVGKRAVEMIPLPGHSSDGIGVLIVEDRVLFSGDVMMPVPYLVDGDYDDMVASLKRIPRLKLENLVQGHGEVVLRGEISNAVRVNLNYLNAIRRHVRNASRRKDPAAHLASVGIETCGKSRILLGGLATELHQRNMIALLRKWYPQG